MNSFSEAARRLKIPVATLSRRVAALEDQLGLRLLERSTRSLRLTAAGSQVLEHAQHSAHLSELVGSIATDYQTRLSGVLRLSAPPSISDSLLTPLANAFQSAHPDVRIQVLVTERMVDHIEEGIDLVFRLGPLKDSTMVARTILTYRHQVLASPSYLKNCPPLKTPQDLLRHRLIAFSRRHPEIRWNFAHINGRQKQTVAFEPYLSMNDYLGIAAAILAGAGIGELPPIVQPNLVRDGLLVEIMPRWRFKPFNLSIVHLGNRHIPKPVRVFKDFAVRMAPTLFPSLPL